MVYPLEVFLPLPCTYTYTFGASVVDSKLATLQLHTTLQPSSLYACTVAGPDVHTHGRHAKVAMDKSWRAKIILLIVDKNLPMLARDIHLINIAKSNVRCSLERVYSKCNVAPSSQLVHEKVCKVGTFGAANRVDRGCTYSAVTVLEEGHGRRRIFGN